MPTETAGLMADRCATETEVTIMDKQTEYVEKLSAQMVEWDVRIERLKDQAESATPEEKFEYSNTIAALQLKRDEAAIKLQGIAAASDDEWEELKTGAEQIWDEARALLHNAFTKTKSD
jgi:hypothetical protein